MTEPRCGTFITKMGVVLGVAYWETLPRGSCDLQVVWRRDGKGRQGVQCLSLSHHRQGDRGGRGRGREGGME